MRVALRALSAVLLAGLAVCCASPAAAGSDEQLVLHPAGDESRRVEVRVRWGPAGGIGTNGWGWVRVDVLNKDAETQTVALSVDASGLRPVQRSLSVAAGSRATTWLPRLPGQGYDTLQATLPSGGTWSSQDYGGNERTQILFVGDAPAWKRLTDAILKRASPGMARGRGASARLSPTTAEEIPDRWTCMTAASLTIVDGAAAGLDATQPQRTIAQALAAGAAVLIVRPASLPPGPLKDALAHTADGSADRDPTKGLVEGRHGLGQWWALVDPEGAPALEDRFADEWLRRTMRPLAPTLGAGLSEMPGSLTPEGFLSALEIPGLGEVPVRMFFFLILGFAILVGPVAYLTLKRRRRLTRMLWLVPASGLGFAGAILLYGLLSEGLGTKGSVRSLTLLDQRTHDACGAAHRTLYAGLAPGELRVSPDTLVHASNFSLDYDYSYRRAFRIVFDLDAGLRIRGDALPSRTPTTFATVSQGRARERLRFRRLADGRYEMLPSPGFEPLDEPGSLVLHAPDGTWHVAEGHGKPLRAVTPEGAERLLRTLRETVTGAPLAVSDAEDESPSTRYLRARRRGSGERAAVEGTTASLVGTKRFTDALTDPVPPGAYLGWMSSAPGFDDLGLEVRWLLERHLVLGILAAEDVDG